MYIIPSAHLFILVSTSRQAEVAFLPESSSTIKRAAFVVFFHSGLCYNCPCSQYGSNKATTIFSELKNRCHNSPKDYVKSVCKS